MSLMGLVFGTGTKTGRVKNPCQISVSNNLLCNQETGFLATLLPGKALIILPGIQTCVKVLAVACTEKHSVSTGILAESPLPELCC